MSCSESPAANSFLVDSLISSGRGEAAGAGGGGGGGGGYYPNSGIYLPQASDLSYGLQSCGLFPVLGKRNEGTSQSMVPGSHPYVSGMEVWLDPPRSCRMEEEPTPNHEPLRAIEGSVLTSFPAGSTDRNKHPATGDFFFFFSLARNGWKREGRGEASREGRGWRLPSSPCFPPP
uniref:HOXA10 n=1 Tax=Buteo japonicus TaxID=224669 RepID=A0A8C0AZ01_9AVES